MQCYAGRGCLESLLVRQFTSRWLAHTDGVDDAGRKGSTNGTQAQDEVIVSAALLAVRRAMFPEDSSVMRVALENVKQPSAFEFLRNLFGNAGRFNRIVDDVVLLCL
jgi:hypothetical protein